MLHDDLQGSKHIASSGSRSSSVFSGVFTAEELDGLGDKKIRRYHNG